MQSVRSSCRTSNPYSSSSRIKPTLSFSTNQYARTGKPDDWKRVHQTVANSFEHAAGLGGAMVGAAFLQTALDNYREAGLTEEGRRVRILMQEKIGEAKNIFSFLIRDIFFAE